MTVSVMYGVSIPQKIGNIVTMCARQLLWAVSI